MNKIVTTVLCAAMAVCNTINAQEIMKENKSFAETDMSAFRSHNGNPWGWFMPAPLRKTKQEQ